MTVTVRRWFLGLVALTAVAAIVSYLLIVLKMSPDSKMGRVGDCLLLAVILVTSIGITHVISHRLSRGLEEMSPRVSWWLQLRRAA